MHTALTVGSVLLAASLLAVLGLILPADPNARHASGQSRRAKREPRALAEPANVAS